MRRARRRDDYQPSEDDNVLVEGVSGDSGGLAYFGFSYYEQNADALNLVSVDDGNGCVAPSAETIQDGAYAPLARPLFMYPSAEALERPEVEGFMNYVVDNYDTIAEAALIVPMDETQAADAAARSTGRWEASRHETAEPVASWKPERKRQARRRGSGPSASRAVAGARRSSAACSSSPRVISILTTVGIVFALVEESLSFFGEVGTALLHRLEVVAAVRRPAVRDLAASQRHLPDHRDRDPRRGPARARVRGLPLRVRVAAGAPDRQADHRGARRRPDDRLRLLRADLRHADGPPGHPQARHDRVQRARGRTRDGGHDHADDRLDLRGLDASGSAGPARGRLRASARRSARSRPRSSSRPRSRASSPRSCSGSRAGSARR